MSKTIGKVVGGTITGGITGAGQATSNLLSSAGQGLGFGGGGGSQTTTTTPNIPQYVADYQKQMFDRAQETAFGRPGFFGFGGTPGLQARQFADFSGLQNQGFSALSGINQNAGIQGAQNALAGLQGMGFGADRIDPMMVSAQNFLQGNISAYQNPYTDAVVNQSLADIDRARIMQQQGVNAQALSRGAFGGSRQAIAEAENNRNFLDQQARTSAGLRQQGFDTAAGLMQADMNRALQAGISNQAAGLTAGTQNANNQLQAQQLRAGALSNALSGGLQFNQSFLGNLNAQLGAGAMQQELAQQRLDAQRNLPMERLGILSSTFTGGQLPYGQSQTSPVQKGNPFLSGIGGAAAGAGLATALGGSAATGAGLGALAAFL